MENDAKRLDLHNMSELSRSSTYFLQNRLPQNDVRPFSSNFIKTSAFIVSPASDCSGVGDFMCLCVPKT
jgi:hypothetical protein